MLEKNLTPLPFNIEGKVGHEYTNVQPPAQKKSDLKSVTWIQDVGQGMVKTWGSLKTSIDYGDVLIYYYIIIIRPHIVLRVLAWFLPVHAEEIMSIHSSKVHLSVKLSSLRSPEWDRESSV